MFCSVLHNTDILRVIWEAQKSRSSQLFEAHVREAPTWFAAAQRCRRHHTPLVFRDADWDHTRQHAVIFCKVDKDDPTLLVVIINVNIDAHLVGGIPRTEFWTRWDHCVAQQNSVVLAKHSTQ